MHVTHTNERDNVVRVIPHVIPRLASGLIFAREVPTSGDAR